MHTLSTRRIKAHFTASISWTHFHFLLRCNVAKVPFSVFTGPTHVNFSDRASSVFGQNLDCTVCIVFKNSNGARIECGAGGTDWGGLNVKQGVR